MMPIVMLGSLLGVFVNIIFPAMILQACLIVLWIFTTTQSAFKARELYRKESAA